MKFFVSFELSALRSYVKCIKSSLHDVIFSAGLFGRRCKSTPGIIESHEKVSLEDMWISPFTDNLTHRNISLDPHFHQMPSTTPVPSPSYRYDEGRIKKMKRNRDSILY